MIVWSLVLGVAAYRLWRLVGEDAISEPMREKLTGWPLKLVSCPWCLGSWIAFGLTWATDAAIGLPAPFLVGLCAATVVGFIGERL